MEPVTHVLTSLALSRAGLDRTTRLATPLLIAAGLAPDLDWASLALGPRVYLACHRAATHSLVGGAAVALVVAAGFYWIVRTYTNAPVRIGPALLLSFVGVGSHILLDLSNSYGTALLWPFGGKRYAGDLTDWLDVWILLILVAGLGLPWLFRLVSEEIGARPSRRVNPGAITALVLVALYCGGRAVLHARALELLGSRMYHSAAPLLVGAFPTASPLDWRGVVDTRNTIETLDVSLSPDAYFDPDRSRTHFKPEPSPALDAARATRTAQLFLQQAQFPLGSVLARDEGYRVELRDLAGAETAGPRNAVLVIELDRGYRVVAEELR